MYCQLDVAIIYLTCTIIFAIVCFVICLFEWIHRPEHKKYKGWLYATFGGSLSIPLSHILINELIFDNYGDPFEFSSSFVYYVLLAASYFIGLYIYVQQCPERNRPGRYNTCGHSHQIWHGFVVLGIFFTYLGALENFEMRKISVCPA
jgi:adiponectin receptor